MYIYIYLVYIITCIVSIYFYLLLLSLSLCCNSFSFLLFFNFTLNHYTLIRFKLHLFFVVFVVVACCLHYVSVRLVLASEIAADLM